MKFTTTTENFKPVIRALSGVARQRTTLPVLSNVLIQAGGGKVTFTGTDLEMEIIYTINASVAEQGATTCPAKRLFDIVGALPSGDLEIQSGKGDTLKINSGVARYGLNGLPAEDFPKRMDGKFAGEISVPKDVLAGILRKTLPCVSIDESRPILQSLYMEVKDSSMVFAACDSRRLSVDSVAVDFDGEIKACVPPGAQEEMKQIASGDGDVKISFAENQIRFVSGEQTITSKLMEGNYPNFRQVIPSEIKEKIVLPRELVLESIRRVSIMASQKSFSVRLEFGQDELVIMAKSEECGEGRETVPIKYSGKPMAIAFSPEYLIDAFAMLSESEITIGLIDELSAATITTTGEFIHVIMPMRLS